MQNKTGEISKTILKGILTAGVIVIASTSPYFISRTLPKIIKYACYHWKNKRQKNKFAKRFSYLKNHGLINIENKRGQIYISLTEEGKKLAGKYQIDDLRIKKSGKWDKKWRILIFDIKNKQKIKREALRGKIKELKLYQLQKSVWIYPYDFRKEMSILRKFFQFTKDEMQIIIADEIENDQKARIFFGLKTRIV
jgi:hypothetical protein